MDHEDEDGYAGSATLHVADAEFAVTVELRGYFQPIDGRYHWYGRIAADDGLAAALGGRKHPARLRTAHTEADGEVSEPDTWGRYRIGGVGAPPFALPPLPEAALPEVGRAGQPIR